ncbi:hypothetical protein [Kribbella sp. NPDC050459]|uniref:hypothetical protein n=1 Tax=Kribbella sp. NPDC050459 TaxID=3155785 RepID=UPI0033D775E4
MEVVLTAFFLYVILGATDDRAPKGFAPIAGISYAAITGARGAEAEVDAGVANNP